jgi:hypothetical protein
VRNTKSSGVAGSTSTSCGRPLTLILKFAIGEAVCRRRRRKSSARPGGPVGAAFRRPVPQATSRHNRVTSATHASDSRMDLTDRRRTVMTTFRSQQVMTFASPSYHGNKDGAGGAGSCSCPTPFPSTSWRPGSAPIRIRRPRAIWPLASTVATCVPTHPMSDEKTCC